MATREATEQDTDSHGGGQLAQLRDFIKQATAARVEYERAAGLYAMLVFLESKLEAERHGVKEQIVKRLMGPGPEYEAGTVGEGEHARKVMMNKPGLSATAAEKAATTDPEYLAHLKLQRETVRDKNNAHTRMESARMRVKILLASVRAIGGVI